MVAMKDMSGQKFGSLTVIDYSHSDKTSNGNTACWNCICDCGKLTVVQGVKLRTGNTKSCGCLKFKAGDYTRTHGKANTKSYQLWAAMIQRAKGNRYHTYKDFGIGVCDKWLSFEGFYSDMGNPPAPKYSLERIDNNKGYSKENCMWIPMKDQWRNRRNTKLHPFNGKLLSYREIEEELGFTRGTLRRKIVEQGKSFDEATCLKGS